VQEVDLLVVDRGDVLGELVERRLVRAPVVTGAPVFGEVPQVGRGHPTAPADVRQRVRPAGAGQPGVQVVELGLRDVDGERVDAQVLVRHESNARQLLGQDRS
jgi:hypothetical protein